MQKCSLDSPAFFLHILFPLKELLEYYQKDYVPNKHLNPFIEQDM